MIVWIWANLVLTALALTFVKCNSTAPHRLRFIVCFLALCCWLVPWNLLSRLGLTRAFSIDLFPGSDALGISGQLVSSGNAAQSVPPTSAGFAEAAISRLASMADASLIVATIIGVLLFAASCYRYSRLLARLRRGSTEGLQLWTGVRPASKTALSPKPPNTRIQREVPGALTTGVFSPTVWIHVDLLASPSLEAVLVHESTHARHHDNVYLWAITLVQRVLWWNPAVYLLAYQARRLQELSCDEACVTHLSNYRAMLSRLILSLSMRDEQRDHCLQAPSVYGLKSFSVHRIRALEQRYDMRTRHYASTASLLLVSLLALGYVTAQEAVVSDESPVRFETMEEAEDAYQRMIVYAEVLDRQWDLLNAENQALRQEIAELRSAIAAESAEEIVPITGPDGDYRLIRQISPIYPPRAAQRGVEGYVIVEHAVTDRGTTADLTVVESTNSLFEVAAMNAVRKFEYEPRIEGGVAVAVSGVRTRVDFELLD